MRNTHVRSICFLLLAGTTAGIFRLGLNHAAETPATGPKPKPPEDPHPAELAALQRYPLRLNVARRAHALIGHHADALVGLDIHGPKLLGLSKGLGKTSRNRSISY